MSCHVMSISKFSYKKANLVLKLSASSNFKRFFIQFCRKKIYYENHAATEEENIKLNKIPNPSKFGIT